MQSMPCAIESFLELSQSGHAQIDMQVHIQSTQLFRHPFFACIQSKFHCSVKE